MRLRVLAQGVEPHEPLGRSPGDSYPWRTRRASPKVSKHEEIQKRGTHPRHRMYLHGFPEESCCTCSWLRGNCGWGRTMAHCKSMPGYQCTSVEGRYGTLLISKPGRGCRRRSLSTQIFHGKVGRVSGRKQVWPSLWPSRPGTQESWSMMSLPTEAHASVTVTVVRCFWTILCLGNWTSSKLSSVVSGGRLHTGFCGTLTLCFLAPVSSFPPHISALLPARTPMASCLSEPD